MIPKGVLISHFSLLFSFLMHFQRNGTNSTDLIKTLPCSQHVKNRNMIPSYAKSMHFKIHKLLFLQLTMEFGCTQGSAFINLY